MNNLKSSKKSQNIKDQKQIYETIKQDIMSLAHIKNKFNDVIRKNHIRNPVLFIKGEKSYFSKKSNIRNNALIIENSKRKTSSLINLEKKINKRFHNLYFIDEGFYNVKIINEIISNENSHIVAEFKDFLIKDDYSEFIQRFYNIEDSIFLLKQIFEYYRLSSVVYPNYILLSENKYIYRNIQKKQKIIDDQQEQEEKKNNNKKRKNLDLSEMRKEMDKSEKVFDSKVIDSILNQSNSSQIQKFIFGVSAETSFDIEDNNIFNLVKNINKAEETCYSKYIEKNKLINNNSINNNKNSKDFNNIIINKNNLKKENNQFNNQIKRNINKVRQLINISNNIFGNKIKTRNLNNFTEISNFTKTQSNLISNINKERNLYSFYLDKNPLNQTSKINKINKNKTLINTNCIYDKNINITSENIKNICKLNKNKNVLHNKNMKSNILDSRVNNEYLRTYDNNFISIENNNISSRNLKINKKKNDKLGNIKKDFKLKMAPTNKELSKEKLNKNLIKKTLINELLSSLGTSFKETWKNSKLTESQGELSKSIKKLDRERKIIRTLNINDNYLINKKKLNNTRNIIDIKADSYNYFNSKTLNNDKRNKQMSLDIDLISNKINSINKDQLNSNTFENQYSKDSNFNMNLTTEKNTITTGKKEEDFRNISKQFINSNNFNLKDKKSIDKDIRREFKYNAIFNKIKSRNKMRSIINDSQNANSIININSNRNHINGNNSTKKTNNYCSNDLTYTMINMKKYININSIDKSNFKNIPNNNRINQHETITDIPTSLKNKLRLNFDFLKKSQINQNEKSNKKIKSNRNFLLTSKNSENIRRGLIKNNHKHNYSIFINKFQKMNKLPLSERTHKVNTNRSCNNRSKNIDNTHKYNGILKNSEKSKNNDLKTLINEINFENLLLGYSNSYKNKSKYIKKLQYPNNDNQNQHLILSNIINKKDEENNRKVNYNTISQIDRGQRKRKKISNHIYSNSNCFKNDIISLLNNDYHCLDNNSNSKRNKNNIDNNNDYIDNNKEKSINNINLINSPNKLNKIPKNIKTNKNTSSKEMFIFPNRSTNNKNEKYYNIELNINDKNNNKDISSINKINADFAKQHIKLNSTTQLSTGSLNINFNNYTNNYCFNYSNNSVLTTNQNNTKNTKIEPKNYKHIKAIKNNIKGIQIKGFDKIIKNKKSNFLPLTLTDRNKQIRMYLHK